MLFYLEKKNIQSEFEFQKWADISVFKMKKCLQQRYIDLDPDP